MTMNLNAAETKVMAALIASSADNGHDFGIMEEVKVSGMSRQALGGYVSVLAQKGLVTVYDREKVNEYWVTQFKLSDEVIEIAQRTERQAAANSEPVSASVSAPAPMSLRDVLHALEIQTGTTPAEMSARAAARDFLRQILG
jgi:DNA-binding transcriptional ArsR family regulator